MEQEMQLKSEYEKRVRKNRLALFGAIAITLCIGAIVVWVGLNNVKGQAERYADDVQVDYTNLMESYTRTFNTVYDSIVDKIKENPSFEEMDAWLKSKDKAFANAMGSDIYDGIAITYKGRYAHSWNYGNYDNYDASTRRWYQVAAEAKGKTTLVAPYVTYLDSQMTDNETYILMSVVRKYNDSISFDYDIKIKEINKILSERKLLYPGTQLFMYDKDGYVLSTSEKELFAHNVYKADRKITKNFSKMIKSAQKHPGRLQIKVSDGTLKCLYVTFDKSGNAICMSSPLIQILKQDFLAIQLVVLILILFEIYLYRRNNRSLIEYKNRDEQLTVITRSTFLERVFIRLQDGTFYGNEKALEHVETNAYEELYAYMKKRVINENEAQLFEEYLSPNVLKHMNLPMNQLETRKFLMDWPTDDGIDKQCTMEINLMHCVMDEREVAVLLLRDVSEDATVLREALEQAKSANEAKSGFLSRMSHEIRTPMNAIVGLTTIAKQHEREPEKVEAYLTKIETSSRVLLNIINDVLDMSAIENNKLKIADEEFDMKQILTSISTIYYPQCDTKGIKFEMMTDLEDEMFKGDSLRISQVLLNLVSNAYKFTNRGGTIQVSAKENTKKDGKSYVEFQVTDTGAGMSKGMMERLFRPFEQETATTAKKHGGSGLGLSIAKNLVDMMHGAIKVESEKGVGTTFTVDLPLEVVNQKSQMNREILSSTRVLVADDDEASREYTGIVLERIGVEYEIAMSGLEAVDFVIQAINEHQPYDVVMIDWKMPDIDGVEVARRVRERDEDVMIVIVSAYDINSVEEEAKKAGADHFVAKPLFQSTVFNLLMSLSHGQLHTDSAEPSEYDFTGYKVLMAEDNDLNAEIAMELLDMVNLKVDHAPNGQVAVEMFEQAEAGTYGAILMDMQMPVMDGCAATRKIRALKEPDGSKIPIYAMTANAFMEDISLALSAGMNGHIAKPIDTNVLYQTLEEVLKK